MNLLEAKKKVFGMIEELNPNAKALTDDPDLAAKVNEIFNQVMFELARIKRLPKYVEIEVKKGDLVTFDTIEAASGYAVYQVDTVSGAAFARKAKGTIIKALEDGTLEIEFFAYPERITEKTADKAYEFELSADLLEILPYGVAADLLKSDVSTEYGRVYAERYERMKAELDPEYESATYTFEGGVPI